MKVKTQFVSHGGKVRKSKVEGRKEQALIKSEATLFALSFSITSSALIQKTQHPFNALTIITCWNTLHAASFPTVRKAATAMCNFAEIESLEGCSRHKLGQLAFAMWSQLEWKSHHVQCKALAH